MTLQQAEFTVHEFEKMTVIQSAEVVPNIDGDYRVQNRLMLLIVVNHEKPQDKQPGEDAADNPSRETEIPERPRNGSNQ